MIYNLPELYKLKLLIKEVISNRQDFHFGTGTHRTQFGGTCYVIYQISCTPKTGFTYYKMLFLMACSMLYIIFIIIIIQICITIIIITIVYGIVIIIETCLIVRRVAHIRILK
jgi:hypothetical protein